MKDWEIHRSDEKTFEASRLDDRLNYDKTVLVNADRTELWVEFEDDGIVVSIEDGDNGGRGAERHMASGTLDYETMRALIEWAAPKVFGS